MYDRTMADMCCFFQQNSCSRKHMDRTVLLHITAIFNDDLPPVATDRSTRTNIYISSDNNIACNSCIRVNECAFVDDWLVAIEFVDHFIYQILDVGYWMGG